MTSEKELKLAYGLAIVLFVVGVLSYAAFSAKAPEPPARYMFNVAAGKVFFDHKTHNATGGYGISCADCHHHPVDDESANRACGGCHTQPEQIEQAQETCTECHEADEFDIEEVPKRGDAFHTQCIGCHQDYEAGPREDVQDVMSSKSKTFCQWFSWYPLTQTEIG